MLTPLVLYLKFSDHVIKGGDGPFEGYTATTVNLGTHELIFLGTGKITPKESFTNAYAEEVFD